MISNEKEGLIDLYYFDESGVSLTPVVPYAWQHKQNLTLVPSSKSKQLNILGFINRENHLTPYVFEESVNSDVVIACFDDFAESLQKPSVVIIDNAPTHRSQAFLEKKVQWKEKGLFIYNLPPYSPELNKIEILWKHIKYHWMPFEAYTSFDKLRDSLDFILCNVGKEYVINYV